MSGLFHLSQLILGFEVTGEIFLGQKSHLATLK